MNNETTIVPTVSEPMALPTTEVQKRIDAMIENRNYFVEKVTPMLKDGIDTYKFEGMKKPSLGKPGAEKLAAIFGLSAEFVLDKETMDAMGDLGGKRFIAYICNLKNKQTGEQVGQGRGAAFIELERTNYRNVNEAEFAKIKDTLKPEDYQERRGQYGKYYRVKDGVVFDQLAPNKAIKMAQKSAFVDGVIRTTGMSDLFTQDVEDMTDLPNDDEKPEQPKTTEQPKPVETKKTEAVEDPFVDEQKHERKCLKCDTGKMLKKNRRDGTGSFLGCSNYPDCKSVENV